MAMHTIVLLLEAAGNVNRKAKVFHAMHNWILNGLLMTLAGANNSALALVRVIRIFSILVHPTPILLHKPAYNKVL